MLDSSSVVIKHHPHDTEYSHSDNDDSRPIPSPFSVIGDDPIDPDEVNMTGTEDTDANNEDSDEEEKIGPSTNTEDQSIITEHPLPWFGFKITGDNIDKNIRASMSFQISLHCFHSFASRDIDAEKFLPSEQDAKEEFCILVTRYVLIVCLS